MGKENFQFLHVVLTHLFDKNIRKLGEEKNKIYSVGPRHKKDKRLAPKNKAPAPLELSFLDHIFFAHTFGVYLVHRLNQSTADRSCKCINYLLIISNRVPKAVLGMCYSHIYDISCTFWKASVNFYHFHALVSLGTNYLKNLCFLMFLGELGGCLS